MRSLMLSAICAGALLSPPVREDPAGPACPLRELVSRAACCGLGCAHAHLGFLRPQHATYLLNACLYSNGECMHALGADRFVCCLNSWTPVPAPPTHAHLTAQPPPPPPPTHPTAPLRDNYCELFGVILHGNVNMQLPVPWLWDMVDEFLYQFQSFCQFRSKLAHKSAEEIELLRQCDKVWALLDVLNVLQALVDKSGIVAALEADGAAGLLASGGYPTNSSNVLPLLGYFSLLGQLRVHALVGDYATGLSALYPLNLFERRGLFTATLPPAHISLYYYGCFSYLMLRRYSDAATCLNIILSYIARVKAFHARNSAYEQMLKKNEQMYALLACAVALCPAVTKGLDEGVLVQLREKYADKLQRMARGDEAPFEELFSYGCPKFVSPAPPAYDNPQATNVQEVRSGPLCFVN